MNPALIDRLVFEALQANAGADFVLQLVEAFADEAPQLVMHLRAAAAAGDSAQFETIAHSLKSNGVTFGAHRLAELAGRLEWQGLAGSGSSSAEIKDVIEQLATELAAVLQALRALARS